MNVQDRDYNFESDVRCKGREQHPWAVAVAIAHYQKQGWDSKPKANGCVELAGLMGARAPRTLGNQVAPQWSEASRLGARLGATRLERLIDKDAQDLRRTLFKTEDPPFNEVGAYEWIESQPKIQPRVISEELREEIKVALFGLTLTASFLFYMKPKGLRDAELASLPKGTEIFSWSPEGVKVPPGSKLAALKAFAEMAKRKTGVDEHDLVAYALSGTPLIYPPVTIDGVLPYVKVTIRSAFIREADLKEVYRQIKTAPGSVPDLLDEAILLEINALGKLPLRRGGRGEYWARLAKKVGQRTGRTLTGDQVRMRCNRLRDKVPGHRALRLLE